MVYLSQMQMTQAQKLSYSDKLGNLEYQYGKLLVSFLLKYLVVITNRIITSLLFLIQHGQPDYFLWFWASIEMFAGTSEEPGEPA
jgi:hypothetical protein